MRQTTSDSSRLTRAMVEVATFGLKVWLMEGLLHPKLVELCFSRCSMFCFVRRPWDYSFKSCRIFFFPPRSVFW